MHLQQGLPEQKKRLLKSQEMTYVFVSPKEEKKSHLLENCWCLVCVVQQNLASWHSSAGRGIMFTCDGRKPSYHIS